MAINVPRYICSTLPDDGHVVYRLLFFLQSDQFFLEIGVDTMKSSLTGVAEN